MIIGERTNGSASSGGTHLTNRDPDPILFIGCIHHNGVYIEKKGISALRVLNFRFDFRRTGNLYAFSGAPVEVPFFASINREVIIMENNKMKKDLGVNIWTNSMKYLRRMGIG